MPGVLRRHSRLALRVQIGTAYLHFRRRNLGARLRCDSHVASAVISCQHGGAEISLRTMQIGGADLHAGSAKRECRRNTPASPMPPAAITGTFTASAICGTSANVPTWRRWLSVRKHPSMATRLIALRDHRIDAGCSAMASAAVLPN